MINQGAMVYCGGRAEHTGQAGGDSAGNGMLRVIFMYLRYKFAVILQFCIVGSNPGLKAADGDDHVAAPQ
jgi:hypothetical protein